MPDRDPGLQALLDALVDGIDARVAPGSAPEKALARVQASLLTAGQAGTAQPQALKPAGHAYLAPALAAAKANGGYAARVVAALAALDPQITWYGREGLVSERPDFAERHALTTLVGPQERPGVLEVRADVLVGISLVAPETPYPDHHHPPEELYLALTGGEWRQDLGPWFAPGPDGIVYNAPNTLHGMRALAEPQLALWCLPLP